MFAKRLLQKATQNHHLHRQNDVKGNLIPADLDFRIPVHYGIPSTASALAFDPIQRLLAIGTLDGRIKVIGGDNIEGLLISPQQLPYKYLEFLSNQGYLVSISNDNNIQVWNLEIRAITCSLQWESNITAFSLIQGSHFMYVGDEYGMLSVLKHEVENGELFLLPYHISANSLSEAAGSSISNHQPIVGVLPQPWSSGNRLLIAYESGLIVLWDVVEAQVLVVRGDKVLELKDGVVDEVTSLPDATSGYNLEEKEISALCWASSNGSILAAGYVDGDILFWKTSTYTKGKQAGRSCNNVIKLQLSSAERRLPVIVLHWLANSKSQHDGDGQLFIYGGDEIGSDEVLTVLSLEWHPGMETVRCVGRAELTLTGSFADMILLPRAAPILNSQIADLFVLTSPGHLQFFSHESLSALASQHEKRITLSSLEFPVVIPTVNPTMTTAKLCVLLQGERSSRFLSEIATHIKHGSTASLNGGKWPLTGGVANQIPFSGNHKIYIAGYLDGSVRIWDATAPVLSLLCVIPGEVKGVEVADSGASVSELDFCSLTLSLAVGNERGLIRIYNLNGSSKETGFHVTSETKHDVHNLPQGEGLNCRGVFCLLNSPVQALRYEHNGAKLYVGYKCGRVAVLDVNLFSVLFLTNCPSSPSSPVISMTWTSLVLNDGHPKSPNHKAHKNPDKPSEELMFVLTKDAKVYVFNGGNGDMINSEAMSLKKESTAVSINVLEENFMSPEEVNQKPLQQMSKDAVAVNEPSGDTKVAQQEIGHQSSPKSVKPGRSSMESLVLLCCKDALRLYRLKSVLQGDKKTICKVKLSKPCCWSSTVKKDGKICGLVLLYETGEIDVRSLPDLELVKETSLMSTLRWNFKANMHKTMTSTDCGKIALANGNEVAFISLLTSENDFRIPESLPSLHDKVLAAAAEAAISSTKKKQGAPGVLGNIVKGLKGGKGNNKIDITGNSSPNSSHLDEVFARNPFPDPSQTSIDSQEDYELDIDEIEIDEPVPVASTSSHMEQNDETRKRTDRQKLFDGDGGDPTPRLRTRDEIIATYRKAGDASSVAGQAKDKLLERQEKLERISKRTEDLRSGAEDFASLANELVKEMERRKTKWWQI